jgi:hypothetical protein
VDVVQAILKLLGIGSAQPKSRVGLGDQLKRSSINSASYLARKGACHAFKSGIGE